MPSTTDPQDVTHNDLWVVWARAERWYMLRRNSPLNRMRQSDRLLMYAVAQARGERLDPEGVGYALVCDGVPVAFASHLDFDTRWTPRNRDFAWVRWTMTPLEGQLHDVSMMMFEDYVRDVLPSDEIRDYVHDADWLGLVSSPADVDTQISEDEYNAIIVHDTATTMSPPIEPVGRVAARMYGASGIVTELDEDGRPMPMTARVIRTMPDGTVQETTDVPIVGFTANTSLGTISAGNVNVTHYQADEPMQTGPRHDLVWVDEIRDYVRPTIVCSHCVGRGFITSIRETCETCGGLGALLRCERCNGSGRS